MSDAARLAAERVARGSYGRLVALIAARTRDIAAAEDALADAFQTALRVWPERGVPDNPEAWLLTAARRTIGHGRRHAQVRERAAPDIATMLEEYALADQSAGASEIFPDQRLKLLFVCAHPAIDPNVHTPLMLQTVLGLDAAEIAAAFLVAPATMSQRLVRAKTKIRNAGLRFEEPDPNHLADRLDAVLCAIYAAFGAAWDAHPGAEDHRGLAEEAIYLARLIVALLPAEPEPKGLLALMLYCDARREARRGEDGRFVPLAEQNPQSWSRTKIAEAERLLTEAAAAARFGGFQAEAAIQSVHVIGAVTGEVRREALVALYDLLAVQRPTVGTLVARAAAHGDLHGPEAGLALLDAFDPDLVQAYQPYWASRAHLLQRAGKDASGAFERAIGLATDPGSVGNFV